MKYLEVKEFIESLPDNPLVEYSVDARLDAENLDTDGNIYMLNIEAEFALSQDDPYSKCYMYISEEKDLEAYKVCSNFEFELCDEEREELANKVFRMMKEFVCKQMMRDSND